METDSKQFTKQCNNKELENTEKNQDDDVICVSHVDSGVSFAPETSACFAVEGDNDILIHEEAQSESPDARQAVSIYDPPNYDQPIDLTFSHPKTTTECTNPIETPTTPTYLHNLQNKTVLNVRFNPVLPMQYVPRPRGRRRKFPFTGEDNFIGNPQIIAAAYPGSSGDRQATESKEVEVLKAAKSLFSKRTRTLYHWMYPNAPKAQIKAAVASSWESLGSQEKEFYISQVLGRFGFPQCSLMINPQLGGIKELPPLPDTDLRPTYSELQNAISSISSNDSGHGSVQENCNRVKRKKRQGRPPGSKNRKFSKYEMTCNISQDFQDDPELSKEFEQFALTLNMNGSLLK